jgi:hypothetical protein
MVSIYGLCGVGRFHACKARAASKRCNHSIGVGTVQSRCKAMWVWMYERRLYGCGRKI